MFTNLQNEWNLFFLKLKHIEIKGKQGEKDTGYQLGKKKTLAEDGTTSFQYLKSCYVDMSYIFKGRRVDIIILDKNHRKIDYILLWGFSIRVIK